MNIPGFWAKKGCHFSAKIVPLLYNNPLFIDTLYVSFPSDNQNYIQTLTPRVPVESISEIDSVHKIFDNIQYFDELGRLIQDVVVRNNPTGKDRIQHFDYDEFGRNSTQYLPYTKSTNFGAFSESAETEREDFYDPDLHPDAEYATDDYPWAETVFDNSPLNRIMQQGSPGLPWQPYDSGIPGSGKTVEYDYITNGADDVRIWTISGDNCTNNSYYDANTLHVTAITDENKKSITKEYKDLVGRMVLKESLKGTTKVRTYYVYDDFGLLRYVLPPEFVSTLGTYVTLTPTTEGVLEFCYYFKYDERKRMIEKKLPGADPIKMLYDDRDRLRLSQEGEQRLTDTWSFIKYDILNRPIITGEFIDDSPIEDIQQDINTMDLYETRGTSIHGYTNSSFPTSISEDACYTVNYYDDYDFTYPGSCEFQETGGLSSDDKYPVATGLVTGTKTKVLASGAGTIKEWLFTLNYYDNDNRLIQKVSENHLNGIDRISNDYNFTGDVNTSTLNHTTDFGGNQTDITQVYRYTYDHQGRLIEVRHKLDDNDEILLSAMKYNDLGQLVEKYLHGESEFTGSTPTLQKIDYRYNIRGWMTHINDPDNLANDLFAMELYYADERDFTEISPQMQFNGNIAAVKWNVAGENQGLRAYSYNYDSLNRLLSADYSDEASNWNNSEFDVFGRGESGSSIEYDLNGNITSITRRNESGGYLDRLHYRYAGNQLMALGINGNDAPTGTDHYDYDDNGNLIKDTNKSIDKISYNHLNLPHTITYGSGHRLHFSYDALGNKLRYQEYLQVISSYIESRHYIGNFVYDESFFDEPFELDYILTDEGRIWINGDTYQYEYFLKDHLGNTRIRFKNNNMQAVPIQEAHYYPFGLQFEGELNREIEGDNNYLYNGKEFFDIGIPTENLDWYDYGWRYYDPALARFTTQDRFSEKYYNLSPYQYAADNPILFIDVNGDTTSYYDVETGEYLGTLWGNAGINDRTISKAQLDKLMKEKYLLNNISIGSYNFYLNDPSKSIDDYIDTDAMEAYLNNPDNISTTVIELNSDVGLLARIGYAEFRGGNSDEQAPAMDIVMNRVDASNFPNTIEGVITQRRQFSSLNASDPNRPYYDDPYTQARANTANFNAWTSVVSSALSLTNGNNRGITQGATLYYSPRSMVPANSVPSWNFNLLQEVTVPRVRTNYMRIYRTR